MATHWMADIINDRSFGYELCIELSGDGEHRITIRRSPGGSLVIELFARDSPAIIPSSWLADSSVEPSENFQSPERKTMTIRLGHDPEHFKLAAHPCLTTPEFGPRVFSRPGRSPRSRTPSG